MRNFTAVTDVCSQLTILHFSRILPLPHLSLPFTCSWKYG